MKESDAYQEILEEGVAIGEARGEKRGEIRGEVRGKRAALLRLGTKKFGPPDPQIKLALEAIDSPVRLDDLVERCLFVSTWAELLAN